MAGSIEPGDMNVFISSSDAKVSFVLSPWSKLEEVFAIFTAVYGAEDTTYRFCIDGSRIGRGATPIKLGIQDNDVIDAFTEQEGGVTGSGGRMRMPHGNRVSSSAALKTSDMWSKTIG